MTYRDKESEIEKYLRGFFRVAASAPATSAAFGMADGLMRVRGPVNKLLKARPAAKPVFPLHCGLVTSDGQDS
ncbi:hypothetical protein [Streptomyces sp. NPDC023327]|uniref:hypothetical protein n=1 Tax=Streptomyces sp. NPDC023327 TaxID=3157088 RepID=UPI0033FEE0AA